MTVRPHTRGRAAVRAGLGLLLLRLLVPAPPASAQEIRGRVTDAENGEPVGMAGVFVLDRDRNPVSTAGADLQGFFTITAPGTGEYYLYVQRLGYFENESPLVAVQEGGQYGIDFELRPEPIRLDPLEVSVSNEQLETYLWRELGENPNGILGYRVYQGVRLEEAKLSAHDNTDFFRELYVEVQHGTEGVCVGAIFIALPERGSGRFGERECGASIYMNGYPCPTAHIESIDLDHIAVVVRLRGAVYMYTRDFDWTFRPGFRTGAC